MIKVLTKRNDYEFDSNTHYINNNHGTLEIIRWWYDNNEEYEEELIFSSRDYIACIKL